MLSIGLHLVFMSGGAPPPISLSLEPCPTEHPLLLGFEGNGHGNAPLMSSSTSVDCISHSGSRLKERNFLRLSNCSSVGSLAVSNVSEENKNNMNWNATELRLGLPGSRSPERDSDFNLLILGKLDEK
ncbi:Auxin-responsive protein IAA9 [Abeliophyllum distichum]|uniref:Auxin-responsive protein IAA9 n=1 Tax=Abeliophyllum distichum TaxID=126358 RepID=A0ABD1PAG6_9LAMI